MADKKYEYLTPVKDGYRVAVELGENGRRTFNVVVLNKDNMPVKTVKNGQVIDNGFKLDAEYTSFTAEPFDLGMARINYIGVRGGRDGEYGGRPEEVHITRSGKIVPYYMVESLKKIYQRPELATKIKLGDDYHYQAEFDACLDVVQHSYEAIANETSFATQRDYKKYEKAFEEAKEVISALTEKLAKRIGKNPEATVQRFQKLLGTDQPVSQLGGE